MTEDELQKRYPGFHVGPNGEEKVFNHPDDVPEGWVHKRDVGKPAAPKKEPKEPAEKSFFDKLCEATGETPSAKRMKEFLNEAGVEFKGNASKDALAELVLKELQDNDDGSGDN